MSITDCSNVLSVTAATAASTDCIAPCFGKPAEACGGNARLTVYTSFAVGSEPTAKNQVSIMISFGLLFLCAQKLCFVFSICFVPSWMLSVIEEESWTREIFGEYEAGVEVLGGNKKR